MAQPPQFQANSFTHTAPTITTSDSDALAANGNRRYALFINDSTQIMYLHLDDTATANAGIRLEANGGSYEMTQGAGNVYTGIVTAIAVGASGVLLVTEGIRTETS